MNGVLLADGRVLSPGEFAAVYLAAPCVTWAVRVRPLPAGKTAATGVEPVAGTTTPGWTPARRA